jgi:hypothetical protein
MINRFQTLPINVHKTKVTMCEQIIVSKAHKHYDPMLNMDLSFSLSN